MGELVVDRPLLAASSGRALRGHWIGEAMLMLASAMSMVFGAALLWMGRHHPMLGWPFAWQALFNASVCALGGPMAFILLRALDRLLLSHPQLFGYRSVVEVGAVVFIAPSMIALAP